MDAFFDASKKFSLKITTKKTEVLFQPNSTRTREEDIIFDGNKLNSVPEFTSLRSTISSIGRLDDEIQRRIAKASASFGRLRQRLWNNHDVPMQVKGKIYRAVALSTRGLDSVQTTGEKAACLHDATPVFDHEDNLDGHIDNKEILERTGLPSMEDLLIRKNLRWTGHLMRMSPDRLPKQIFYYQLSSGH